jgi:acyl carrier protein
MANSKELLEEIEDIFVDVLEVEDLKLSPTTAAKDIPEWDSLNHILLVVAIEKHFDVRFTTSQIQSWEKVGDLCEALNDKLSK